MKTLATFLAFWMAICSVAPSAALAMPSESATLAQNVSPRAAQIAGILQALSTPAARAHFKMAGLSDEDLKSALLRLDDAQLADVAAKAGDIKAGGDALGVGVAILFITLLVILISNLAQPYKKVESN